MNTKLSVPFVVLLAALVALPSGAGAQSLTGLWDATVIVNPGVEIPFRFELGGSGSILIRHDVHSLIPLSSGQTRSCGQCRRRAS